MRNYIHHFVITYDITVDERRTAVFTTLKGFGEHLQYSVFSCELNETSLLRLQTRLAELIQHDLDQVLFFDLGPVDGRGGNCVTAIGKPYGARSRQAFVL